MTARTMSQVRTLLHVCVCDAHVPSAKTLSASTALEIKGQCTLNAAPGRFSLTCSQLHPHAPQWESKVIYCT